MNFTFNSEQYGTTVEINFKADTLVEIHEKFEQFLRGAGFHFISGDEEYAMHTKQESSDTSEEYVPENDMAHRPNGLTVEDDDIQEYKRPWIGMSDVEVETYSNVYSGISLARMIEALLKERNT
jgi:hypothetical protein